MHKLRRVWGVLFAVLVAAGCLTLAGFHSLVLVDGRPVEGQILRIPRKRATGAKLVVYAFEYRGVIFEGRRQISARMARELRPRQPLVVLTHPLVPVGQFLPVWPHLGGTRIAYLLLLCGGAIASLGVGFRPSLLRWRQQHLLREGRVACGVILRRSQQGEQSAVLDYAYLSPDEKLDTERFHTGRQLVPWKQAEQEADSAATPGCVTVLFDAHDPSRSIVYEYAPWEIVGATEEINFDSKAISPRLKAEIVSPPEPPFASAAEFEIDGQTTRHEQEQYMRQLAGKSPWRARGRRLLVLLWLGAPGALLLAQISPPGAIVFVAGVILGSLMVPLGVERQFLGDKSRIRVTTGYLEVTWSLACSRTCWPRFQQIVRSEWALELQYAQPAGSLLLTERLFASREEFVACCQRIEELRDQPATIQSSVDWKTTGVLEEIISDVTRREARNWYWQQAPVVFRGSLHLFGLITATIVIPWLLVWAYWEPQWAGLIVVVALTLLPQFLLLKLVPRMWSFLTGSWFPRQYTQSVLLTRKYLYLQSENGQAIYPWSRVSSIEDFDQCLAIQFGEPAQQVLLIPSRCFGSTERHARFLRTARELWREQSRS